MSTETSDDLDAKPHEFICSYAPNKSKPHEIARTQFSVAGKFYSFPLTPVTVWSEWSLFPKMTIKISERRNLVLRKWPFFGVLAHSLALPSNSKFDVTRQSWMIQSTAICSNALRSETEPLNDTTRVDTYRSPDNNFPWHKSFATLLDHTSATAHKGRSAGDHQSKSYSLTQEKFAVCSRSWIFWTNTEELPCKQQCARSKVKCALWKKPPWPGQRPYARSAETVADEPSVMNRHREKTSFGCLERLPISLLLMFTESRLACLQFVRTDLRIRTCRRLRKTCAPCSRDTILVKAQYILARNNQTKLSIATWDFVCPAWTKEHLFQRLLRVGNFPEKR